MMSEQLREVVNHFGNQNRLAEALGIGRSAVSLMLNKNGCSAENAMKIEKLTYGKFKAKDLVKDYANSRGRNA